MLGDDVQSYAAWETPLARLNSHAFRLKLCPARLFASGGASQPTARLWTPRCNFRCKKRGCHSPCFRSSSFRAFDPTYAVSSRSPVRYLLARWLEQKRCLSSVVPPIASLERWLQKWSHFFCALIASWRAADHQGSRPLSSSTTNMRSTSGIAITCFFPLGH
jgi:hypothetical protein